MYTPPPRASLCTAGHSTLSSITTRPLSTNQRRRNPPPLRLPTLHIISLPLSNRLPLRPSRRRRWRGKRRARRLGRRGNRHADHLARVSRRDAGHLSRDQGWIAKHARRSRLRRRVRVGGGARRGSCAGVDEGCRRCGWGRWRCERAARVAVPVVGAVWEGRGRGEDRGWGWDRGVLAGDCACGGRLLGAQFACVDSAEFAWGEGQG